MPAETVTRSGAFFPLAGWVIGLCLALFAWLLLAVGLAPFACAALLVGCEAWLTRGLHLDGVADLCDGLGGGHDRQKRLDIMKDSATGAFGVVGLVVLLFLKTAGLTSLLSSWHYAFPAAKYAVLFLLAFVPAVSRWVMIFLAWRSRYPRLQGTGHVFVGKIREGDLFVGFVFLLPVLAILFFLPDAPAILAWICIASLLPTLWLRWQAHKMLGGVTGDVLGASSEFAEACGWLALSLFF